MKIKFTLLLVLFLAKLHGQFIPFATNNGNVFSMQYDDITIGCLEDPNCNKKIWLQIQRKNGEKDVANAAIKCISGEIIYNYLIKYDSQGKQTLNKKVVRVEKMVPGTVNYKLYDMLCNSNENGPAYSMKVSGDESENSASVVTDRAYFYSEPNSKTKRKAFLIQGDTIFPLKETENFVYVEYSNENGIITKGWILKNNLTY